MTHHAPIIAASFADAEPAAAARPGDRWTAAKMAAFLRQLSATHSVSAAARGVGMSRQSAYRLRSRLKGSPFDLAWDVAFHHSYDNLAHAALERALNGVEIPIFYKGEQVGSYRKFDERLTALLLGLATQRGRVPILASHAAEAERHARRFEALVGEVARGADGDAPVGDPGPAIAGEVARLHSLDLSPMSEADFLAELRAMEADDDG